MVAIAAATLHRLRLVRPIGTDEPGQRRQSEHEHQTPAGHLRDPSCHEATVAWCGVAFKSHRHPRSKRLDTVLALFIPYGGMGIICGSRLASWGGILALPWCCVVPAALAVSGVGAGVAGNLTGPLGWGSFLLSVALIARANWLVWVRRQGARAARRWTVSFSAIAVALWAWRFAPYLAWWR